jgi:glycosyltransferase involved in cell wall biosynthesis
MRIGVDACCWANGRGYGRFTRELLRTMVQQAPGEEWSFFVDAEAERVFDLAGPNVRTVRVTQAQAPTQAAAANDYRSPADMLRLTAAVRRERPDVFFSPSVYTYFPLPPGQRSVVAIHDTIAERFPELTMPTRRARLFWSAKVRLAAYQATVVVTVSEYSARELGRVLGIPRDRIRVVGEAPAAAYQPSGYDQIAAAAARAGVPAGAPWFTYVGGFNPHKRVDTIVRAHAQAVAATAGPSPHLLLVGTLSDDVFHGNVEEIRAAVRAAGTDALVHWTGFVPDEELRHLHSGATALILVSEAEGFGLPAVEAAACGAPVIATVESPLPELLEGGGFFVKAGDTAALASAMVRLLSEPALRRAMGDRALARASALSWSDGARAALDALAEAAALRRALTPWEVMA